MSVLKENSLERGFTLVEVLIALAIAGIVLTGVMQVYNSFMKHASSQELLVEAQQNARAGINMIQKELVLIGHRTPFGVSSTILTATSDNIVFRYIDPLDDQKLKVEYWFDDNKLKKKRCKQNSTWHPTKCYQDDGITEVAVTYQTVIDNVDGLTFNYYEADGSPTTTPADVRFVRATLTTETSAVLPNLDTPETRKYQVRTEVRLRNLDITSAASDTTATSQPVELQAREVQINSRGGICGQLKLKWKKGSEADLAGYRIFYTLAGVTESATAPVTSLTEVDGTHYTYTLTGLASSPSDDPSASTYSIEIRSYDSSGNTSVASTPPVSGTSNTFDDFADTSAAADDTTINPSKPPAVTGFVATDGAEGEVNLGWTAYNTENNPDVLGFRIFRNLSAFTSYPVSSEWIVGAAGVAADNGFTGGQSLDVTAESFTDKPSYGTGITGCTIYNYVIVPINCDTTLVSDASDYAGVCGDGTGSCTPGTDLAVSSGQDTAPPDSTEPSEPTPFAARAGYKRVAVSFKQPTDSDISHTCIYAREGAVAPDLDTNPANKDAEGCYAVNLAEGRTVPDSDGAFYISEIAAGSSTTFWHDDLDIESPVFPNLSNGTSYSYTSVAFDNCGNGSQVLNAVATAYTCDEDPEGKPPAVTDLAVECCGAADGVALSWISVPSNSAETSTSSNPHDLAGYRIFRSTDDTVAGWEASVLLNTAAPSWPPSYDDASAADGTAYYYRVVSTDCPYEKNNPSAATIRGHMIDDTLKYASFGPVSPGEILRGEKSDMASLDDHREVLTGVDMNNTTGTGDGSSSPQSSLTHETVTLFLENTSAGTQTINSISVKWVNTSAKLRNVTVGGSGSGMSEAAWSTDITAATTTTDDVDPYLRKVSAVALNPEPQIPAGQKSVPITFTFLNGAGESLDMRDDQLLIELKVTNDSTGKTDCLSYLTTNESYVGIVVPLGPIVGNSSDDGGVTQSNSNITSAYASGNGAPPSDGVTYAPVEATGGTAITVSATIVGGSSDDVGGIVGVSSANIYWVETALTVDEAPASGYTAVSMGIASGDIWSGTISAVASPPSRIWYYIVAIDDDGNFDRKPEVDEGTYIYDQKPFDACDFTPEGISSFSGTSAAGSSDLTWSSITEYDNGDTITKASDPISYNIWRRTSLLGSFSNLTTVSDTPCGADCTFTDTFNNISGDVTYYVVSENSCPNTGDSSNTWRECEGAADAVIDVSPASIVAGSPYTVTVNDCAAATDNLTTNTITVTSNASLGGSYAPVLTETTASSGIFTEGVTTYFGAGSGDILVAPTSGGNDTITVSCTTGCSGTPANKTVTVTESPCQSAPAAPSSFAGSKTGQTVNFTWTANAESDLAGYELWRSNDNGATWGTDPVATFESVDTSGSDNPPGSLGDYDYKYYLIAVDSCLLDSDPSDIAGAY